MKAKFPSQSFWEKFATRLCPPCVGLIVLMICGFSIIAPDPYVTPKPKPAPKKIEHKIPVVPVAPVRHETSVNFPTVVIDPGHGGNDEGCHGHGLKEKDLTLDIAIRIGRLLENSDVPFVLTRHDDRYVALAQRSAIANAISRTVFVSIHFNQFRGIAEGIETFYADQKIPPEFAWTWVGLFGVPAASCTDRGESLAGCIQTSLVKKMDARNRGIRGRGLYVVRHVTSPAVLVEAGFLTNTIEAQMLGTEDYRERLAAGIAEGLLDYIKSQPPGKPPTELATAKN